MRRLVLIGVLLLALPAGGAAAPPGSFVVRTGPTLSLDGKPFRFGGANVEWLGLVGYGPFDPAGPRPPTDFEIDDALETARELGALVVRSQTMGDSVGCPDCIEPTLGRFNDAAFERVDYALASARRHGLRIIPTIVGDDARSGGTGCVNLRWRGVDVPNCSLVNMEPFWSTPAVIADVERHIATLLNHVNVYTGLAYKDDPTILGWDLLNGGGSPPDWTRAIVQFVRTIDTRHLVLSGASNARVAGVDACVSFVYPHWFQPLSKVRPGIAACRSAGKPFIAYEYGWDVTNYRTLKAFRTFLETLRADARVAGDAFWALQAHRSGHGWLPVPADTSDPTAAARLESGQWWALYYPGLQTMVTTRADMASRAQAIRAHGYAMRGLRPPRHARPPAPVVTSVVYGQTSFVPGRIGSRVYWQGSAGARDYSIERAPTASGPWTTICRRCATDLDDGYVDLGAVARDAWYRVVPYNLDGRPGPASKPRQGQS